MSHLVLAGGSRHRFAVLALSIVALLFLVSLAPPARAADKAVWPAVAAGLPDDKPFWSACYLEGGGAARTLVQPHVAHGQASAALLAGLGCTHAVSGTDGLVGRGLVVGAFGRVGVSVADWSTGTVMSFDQPAMAGARAGILLNQTTLLYGLAGYSWGKWDRRHVDGMALGGGLETRILGGIGGLTLGVEYVFEDLGDRIDAHGLSLTLRKRF